MEAYVDNMLVKSNSVSQYIADLEETLSTLRRQGMRLNPTKYIFRASLGKFLGFIVSQRGIEANPDKINAMLDLPPSRTIKEIQNLASRIAALSQFISRSAERCLHFFKAISRSQTTQWNQDFQDAL